MIPLWLKIAYTIGACFVLTINLVKHGWRNLLWLSDVALILLIPALWTESRLLASMLAVGLLLPETVWNLGFFAGLITGKTDLGIADYMFDARTPVALRAVSLFHVALPPLLFWLVARLGYDSRALAAQAALVLVLLPATYLLTSPQDDINWSYGFFGKPQTRLHPLAYLVVAAITYGLLILLPTHLALEMAFGAWQEEAAAVSVNGAGG